MTRLNDLKEILSKENLDAILIYNCPREDPEYARMLLQTHLTSPVYILITKKKDYVICVRWRVEDLKSRSKLKTFISADEQDDKINKVISEIKNFKRIGYLGLTPYKDLIKIKAKKIDVSKHILNKIMIKNKEEISFIKQATRILKNAFNIKIKSGLTEIDISNMIKNNGAETVTVVAGKRLKETTCSEPTNYSLKKNDVVCIDAQTSYRGYNADLTRCYFIGKNKYIKYYKVLEKVQKNVINKLKEGVISKDILKFYIDELRRYNLEKFLVKMDLGHGIGFGRHELPSMGEDEIELKENMIITLEPELNLRDYRIRLEDIILIKKDKAIKL